MDLNRRFLIEGARLLDDPAARAAGVHVHFRDLESRLLGYIADADVVVGCVAWLTNEAILVALTRKAGVSIVVHGEDFVQGLAVGLGTDDGARGWPKLYGLLPSLGYPDTLRWEEPLVEPSSLEARAPRAIQAVRQIQAPAALMHHKFVVFCRLRMDEQANYAPTRELRPYAAWTGSFNFTARATHSLENALHITEPALVAAYFAEWAQLLALSVPLDGSPDWLLGAHIERCGCRTARSFAEKLRWWRDWPGTQEEVQLVLRVRQQEAARRALLSHAAELPAADPADLNRITISDGLPF